MLNIPIQLQNQSVPVLIEEIGAEPGQVGELLDFSWGLISAGSVAERFAKFSGERMGARLMERHG